MDRFYPQEPPGVTCQECQSPLLLVIKTSDFTGHKPHGLLLSSVKVDHRLGSAKEHCSSDPCRAPFLHPLHGERRGPTVGRAATAALDNRWPIHNWLSCHPRPQTHGYSDRQHVTVGCQHADRPAPRSAIYQVPINLSKLCVVKSVLCHVYLSRASLLASIGTCLRVFQLWKRPTVAWFKRKVICSVAP